MGSKMRHQDALENRLEAVLYRGHAFIEWWELNQWFKAERIGKSVWNGLQDTLIDLSGQEDMELFYFETDNGFFLINAKKIKKVSDKL